MFILANSLPRWYSHLQVVQLILLFFFNTILVSDSYTSVVYLNGNKWINFNGELKSILKYIPRLTHEVLNVDTKYWYLWFIGDDFLFINTHHIIRYSELRINGCYD